MTTASAELFRAPGPADDVVIVTPGLNNRPEAMQPIVDTLNHLGYDCLRVALSFGSPARAETIAQDWVTAVADAYARCRAEYSGGRIHAVAYSLGAVVTLAFLQRSVEARVDRLFLLAPALVLTRTARLVRRLTPLRAFGWALPSLAPRSIRMRAVTSLADYHAMLTLVDELGSAAPAPNLRGVPTRVVVNANDELVDAAGVCDWIRQRHLDWPVRVIDNGPATSVARHLLLSASVVGAEGWRVLIDEMASHLAPRGARQ